MHTKKRKFLTNETHEEHVFKIENCRAKARGTGSLVDCLALKQAGFCKFSLSFGNGYFCEHPHRNKIVEDTENSNKANSQTDDNE